MTKPGKTGSRRRPPMTASEELSLASDLFWSLVDLKGPFPPSHTKIKTRCWEWLGSVTTKGRGRFKFNRRAYYARRFAWTLSHGDPVGVLVIDRCGNKNCVRHLATRLSTENLVEGVEVSRYGEKHPNAKLTDQKVRKIRAASAAGKTRDELARTFKVSQTAINNVVTRRAWKHV